MIDDCYWKKGQNRINCNRLRINDKRNIGNGDTPEANAHNGRSDNRPNNIQHDGNSMVNIERQVSDTAETGKVYDCHRDCTKQEGRHLPSSGEGQLDNVELYMAR
eukprot:10455153-Heterocapsa_arctica.AAC.1